jgi:hypothetical protein
MNVPRSVLIVLAVLIGWMPAQLNAQKIVAVKPGPHYDANPAREWLVGAGYRELWQTAIQVPVLDIARYAGGLEPFRQGGGRQTHTLHLRTKEGREYVFRSVDKDMTRAVPDELVDYGIGNVLQDLVALFHPSGALVVPPLLDAVGVLHASPHLYWMPDDARLGEYRTTFGGMLGLLEERPEDGKDAKAGFAGSNSIMSTDKLREQLRADSRNRVAEEEWLAARLVDMVIGDADRGGKQWRWARFNDGELYRWRPIPRDRDFAFINADGAALRVGRLVFKRMLTFDHQPLPLAALTFTSMPDDRNFLQSLDASAWAAITARVQQSLSDAVIDAAVRRMPPEHYAIIGPNMVESLRARRDALSEIVRTYYETVAAVVDVQASDQSELLEIRRRSDGGVEVRLYRGGPDQVAMTGNARNVARVRRPFYQRLFVPSETEEIRIYMHGGDDRIVVTGPNTAGAIKVRIIGGDGADELIDSSADSRSELVTWFYDDEGPANHVIAGRSTQVDDRPFIPPPRPAKPGLTGDKALWRDWGKTSGFMPAIDFRANTGFIVGVQYSQKEFGFRRIPYESQWRARLLYAPGASAFGVELDAVEHFENSEWSAEAEMRASGYDDLRFFGYGNDTPDIESDSSLVEQPRLQAVAGLHHGRGATQIAFGSSMQITDTSPEDGTPLTAVDPLGTGRWTQFGLWTKFETAVSRHAEFRLGGALYPAAASLRAPYGKGRSEAVVRIGSVPQLALRGIGEKIWGDAPFFDAAFIGGRKLLRGYTSYRFAGDASLVGNAELRMPVYHNIGIFLLGDAGRVYFDGESPGGWHTAYGAGVTFSAAEQQISATWAKGEDNKFYITLGHAF